jgi:hypothetical protein
MPIGVYMENGPIPNLDEISREEIFYEFKRAIEGRDKRRAYACIERDGLAVINSELHTIPFVFAAQNDRDSCDFMVSEKMGVDPIEFIKGGFWGDHEELIKYFLSHNDLRKDTDLIYCFACAVGRKELFLRLWYTDKRDNLKLDKEMLMKWRLIFAIQSKNFEDVDDIIEENAPYALCMAARLGKDNYVEKIMKSSDIPQNEWQDAGYAAIENGHFRLGFTLLCSNLDKMKMAQHAAMGGYEEQMMKYLESFSNLSKHPEFLKLIFKTVGAGEVAIAKNLINEYLSQDITVQLYLNLAKEANKNNKLYAVKYFFNKALELQNKVSSVRKLMKIKQATTYTSEEKIETPLRVEKKCIAVSLMNLSATVQGENPIELVTWDKNSQQSFIDKFKDELLEAQDANTLLMLVLKALENEQILVVQEYKGSVFIHENEPAFRCLKQLTLKHHWLNRTGFVDTRTKLEVLNKTTKVSLVKFYDFINECREALLEEKLKPQQAALVEIIKPEATLVLTNNNPNPKVAVEDVPIIIARSHNTLSSRPVRFSPSVSSFSNPNHELNHGNKDKNKNKSKNKGKQNSKKTKVHRQVSQSTKSTSSHIDVSIRSVPLPAMAAPVFVPLKDSKFDLESLVNRNDRSNQENIEDALHPNLQLLSTLMDSRLETSRTLSSFIKNEYEARIVQDLALLDVLFKINRDFSIKNRECINEDLYHFDCDLIHGIHFYLIESHSLFSKLQSFVEKHFAFDSKKPMADYLNPDLRCAHDFVKCIYASSDKTTTDLDRLELIKRLFDLLKSASDLQNKNNEKSALVGRHAASGIMMVLGELYSHLGEVYNKFQNTNVGKYLNTCRNYRNLRHGTQTSNQLGPITFQLFDKKDWNVKFPKLLRQFESLNQYDFTILDSQIADQRNIINVEKKLRNLSL